MRLVSLRIALVGLFAFPTVLLVHSLWGAGLGAAPAQQENARAESGKASTDARANELIKKELQTWELEKVKDKSGYAALMAPHFLAITDRGLMNTPQNLQEIDDMNVETYATTNFKVNFLSKDVALLTYRAKWKGSYQGKPFDESNYSAAIWARRGGQWLDDYYQETIIPPSGQTQSDPANGNAVNAIAESGALRQPQAASTGSIASDLVAKETQTWELAKRRDKTSYSALLGEDFLAVYPIGLFSKEQNVGDLDNEKIYDYSLDGINAVQIVPEVELISYRVRVKGVYKGEAFRNDDYTASVWAKRGGRWLNVFIQETAAR
ncbi:MAG TPA: nuclear transport factor 2 family protein [Candidatus Acidoferrales bacterium]|nr:nuclear transport factor 2 family protein [Candidatus Acidoferrales bacterium]